MKCPLCQSDLKIVRGEQVNPENGWTVYCPSLECPAQEVAGHGRTISDAYLIVLAKFPVDNRMPKG